MAGRHLKDLIVAYQRRDDLTFRRATQAIIEEEEAKKHTALARDLRRMLAAGGDRVSVEALALPEPPSDRDTGVALVDLHSPGRVTFGDLVFPEPLQGAMTQLSDEVALWGDFDRAGVPRRNRILLYGPPGCGKTSVAAAFATDLGLPLAVTRVDSLMSSYLGETAANLRTLFDFAGSVPCVLLLDEFDTIGKLRADPSDHGELRRVVNSVLQLIETYSGPSIVIAATNSPDILDAALWRRFDAVLELPLPTTEQMHRLLASQLPELNTGELQEVTARLTGLPHAAAAATVHATRRSALRHHRRPEPEDLHAGVVEVVNRPWT